MKYTDLLEDWRPVAARLRDELGLTYNTDLDRDEPHAVDDFIEPGLRRHAPSWDDRSVPASLVEIAEAIWGDVVVLGEHAGVDASASEDLDRQGERYRRLFVEAAAISHDATEHAKTDAHRAGHAEGLAAAAEGRGPAVDEVGGRDLLREVGRRAARRLRAKAGR